MSRRSARAAARVAINGRAAVRAEIGGVERLAREMVVRLPALRPDRYRVIRPAAALAHRAGHVWEQAILPLQARRHELIYSPANLAPVASDRNVIVIHDAAALRHPEAYSAPYVAYQRWLLPRLARRARRLITVSEFAKNELIEMLGAAPERVSVIPGGVDERFFEEVDATTAREHYGLQGPYVLALGTVSERKNLGALEPAARALGEQGIDLVLGGSDRGYMRSSGVQLRRLGYIPDEHLPALYVGARAFAMPSRYEGFGLPCLEAMACGTPVVAAARGALPETVGDAGILADPDEPEEFAKALVTAAFDEGARAPLIAAGRRRAAEYPWSRTASLTDTVIGEVLGERR